MIQEHIRDLLSRFQYSEQRKETAVFRILFGREDSNQIMADLDIPSGARRSKHIGICQSP